MTTEIDPRHRRDVRAQSVESRLRIACRLRRSCGASDRLDRRPARVHRSQRDAGCPAALAERRTPVQHGGRRSRSLRRAADDRSSCRRTARIEIVFFLGEAASARRGARADRALPHRQISTPCCRRSAPLGCCPGRGAGEDARPRDGHHAERLAAVSDPGLPRLGALGVLSGERRLWLSRPVAGRHGAGCRRCRR